MKARTSYGQHTLPSEYLQSTDIWRLEQERIFQRHWLLAGHVSSLPENGSYFLYEAGNESVIVLRDGALNGAPNMQEVAGFDETSWGLKPVALTEWRGFLFVNMTVNPPSFDEALLPLVDRFAQWPLAELKSAHQSVYEVEANWKLFFHNYSECYHCPTVHRHLNQLTPYRNSENDPTEDPVLGGPMTVSNPEGSMAMHGNRCAPLLTIGRTRIVCDWYFHPDAIAAPGFDPQSAIDFWDLTNREDWALCENAYRGVCSQAWEPGPYSELESQLAALDRYYPKRLGEWPQSRKGIHA